MFSKNYHEFIIETKGVNWQVRRRFSEFIALREKLSNTFPGLYVPMIYKRDYAKKDDSFM